MDKMKRLYLFLLSFCLLLPAFALTKEEADNLYKAEKYTEAAAAYEKLLSEDHISAALYYNLGNAYYKIDNIPLAVLNYERAYILEPGDGDIRANLTLARSKTIDKVTPPSEMFFVTWWHSLCNMMSSYAWAVVAVIFFALMLIGVLLYMFAYQLTLRKVGAYGAMVLFVLVIIANICAYTQNQAFTERNSAIVTASAISVKSSPNDSSTDLFIMHAGSKVEILDATMKEWVEVKFEEGKQGWVPKSTVEVI